MSSGSGACPSAASTSGSSRCQVRRATPTMHAARGSVLTGSYHHLDRPERRQARDLPGMAMARSAMMFFWISVDPPPMVE